MPGLAAQFAVLSLCLIASPAGAQPVEPGEERQIAELLAPQPGAHICFARDYDQAHLKAHPEQQVQSIGFRLGYFAHDPDEYNPTGQRFYYFELRAALRDGREASSWGECVPSPDGENISCGVDCDGGAVLIRRATGGGKLLVDLEATGRIRMSEGCDGGAGFDLEPGVDDKVFLLSEVPAGSCPHYDDW